MPELLGKRREAKEGLSGRELIPTGIDRIATPFGVLTVIRGKDEEGNDIAILRGVDQEPLELLLGDDNPGREGGALTRFSNNPVVRAIGGLSMAASAFAMAACGTNHGAAGSDHDGPSYSTQSSALTSDQLGNLKGQLLPTTQWGDIPANFAVMNGKNYILIGSDTDPDAANVVYIECDKLADCLSASAQRQYIEGLDMAGIGGGFSGASIYQDKDGKNKLLVMPQGNGYYEGDINVNQNTGKLAVVKDTLQYVTNPKMAAAISLVQENGVPHALRMGTGLQDVNLHDKSKVTYELKNSCAAPALDGNLAIKSHSQLVGGVLQCQLFWADSLANLITKAAPLTSINQTSPSKMLSNPHLATAEDGSGILIYSVEETKGTRIFYALLQKPATPPPDATGDTTPDAADTTDTADAGSETDTTDTAPIDSAAEDTADAVDAIIVIDANDADLVEITEDTGPDLPPELPPEIVEPDNGPETAPDLPPDVADVPPDGQPDVLDASKLETTALETTPEATPDTGPDVPPELPPKDTSAPDVPPDVQSKPDTTPEVASNKCDFAKAKIKVKIGDCALENCQNPIVDINGKCTVEIDLGNAKPVVLEVDGKYSVDLLEEFGTLLAGKFKVIDDGNAFNTVTGNFGTGVEGTTYSGELPDDMHYSLSCQEGRISVYWMPKGAEKQLLGTLDGGQSQTFEIKNPQPIPKADAGKAEPNSPDAGTTSPETTGPETTAADAGKKIPVETPRPPDDGCSVNNGPNKGKSHFGVLALTLLAAASMIRRKRTAKVTA